jgi:uncharacterized protein (TIGR02270 family)
MPDATRARRADASILWNVVEEHLDELEFCVERFESMLDDVELSLSGLADIEERLLANLDGIVVGGAPVVERLLVPAVDEIDPKEPDRTTALALALVALARYDVVAKVLFHEEAAVRRSAVRACGMWPAEELSRWARARLGSASAAEERSALIDVLGPHGVPSSVIVDALGSGHDALVAAAARAARFSDGTTVLPWLERALVSADGDAREPALVTALAFGSPHAWNVCESWALDPKESRAAAMNLYAALGGPAHHAALLQHLARDSHRRHALFALGFSGDPGLVPLLLERIAGPDLLDAKIAAQAVATITGLDLTDEVFAAHPAPDESDLDDADTLPPLEEEPAVLVPRPEEALPVPDAARIAFFWKEVAPRFEPGKRYLGGASFDRTVAITYLERGPLGRRHVLAQAFAIQSGGRSWIDTRAFGRSQLAQIAAIRARHDGAPFRQSLGA